MYRGVRLAEGVEESLVGLLVERGLVTEEQVRHCREASGNGALDGLLERGHCTRDQVRRIAAPLFDAHPLKVVESELDAEALASIPPAVAYRHNMLPVARDRDSITLLMGDPLNLEAIDDVRLVTGLAVETLPAEPEELRRAVDGYYMRAMMDGGPEDGVQVIEEGEEDLGDLARMARETLVIQAVNMIIRQAIQGRASDIHIEPFEKDLHVRYRIDGMLLPQPPPPKRLQAAIISRVKIMANLDIAERRLPQDGRIGLRVGGKDIDLRVSTVPTLHGESVVMRILDKSSVLYGLSELGMGGSDLERVNSLIHRPHGIVLATGPTGSGKTTSLYAALQAIYSTELKIITIEDPVEYQLSGVNQIEVHAKIGLTFARGLRHIVRQDPDVIMVGEIRDAETADIAVHSALTGHVVLSSLHTNDAPGAVTRLADLHVEPFLIASTLNGAIAQRLVRRICTHCKQEITIEPEAFRRLGDIRAAFPELKAWKGRGCDECRGTGYHGRTGLFEVLVVTPEIESRILGSESSSVIRQAAVADGMKSLRDDGFAKVRRGVTTLDEVQRAAQDVIAPEVG